MSEEFNNADCRVGEKHHVKEDAQKIAHPERQIVVHQQRNDGEKEGFDQGGDQRCTRTA